MGIEFVLSRLSLEVRAFSPHMPGGPGHERSDWASRKQMEQTVGSRAAESCLFVCFLILT